MSNHNPLTEAEIKRFVAAWYEAPDFHYVQQVVSQIEGETATLDIAAGL